MYRSKFPHLPQILREPTRPVHDKSRSCFGKPVERKLGPHANHGDIPFGAHITLNTFHPNRAAFMMRDHSHQMAQIVSSALLINMQRFYSWDTH